MTVPATSPGPEVVADASIPAGGRGWLGKRAVSETVLTNGALLGVGAVTGIASARVLGPSGRGQLAVATAVAGIMWPIASLGLQQAFAYSLARGKVDARQAVGLSLLVSFLCGGLVTIVAALAAFALVTGSSRTVIELALLSIPFAIANAVLVGILQGLREGRRFNIARLATPIVYTLLVAAVLIFARHASAASIAVAYDLACVGGAVLAALLLPAGSRRAARPNWDFARETIRYGMFVNLAILGYGINRMLPVIAIGAVGLTSDAGQYSVAMGYALPVSAIAVALAVHSLPDIAAESDVAARYALARRRVKICLITSVPAALLGIFAAPVLVPVAFGHRFLAAVPVAQVLVVAQLALGVSLMLSETSRGLGRPGLPVISEWSGVIATVPLVPLAVEGFGLTAAAGASLLIYCGLVSVLLIGNRDVFLARGKGDPSPPLANNELQVS